jgi:membrane protease YdiL (CAAX protease family)
MLIDVRSVKNHKAFWKEILSDCIMSLVFAVGHLFIVAMPLIFLIDVNNPMQLTLGTLYGQFIGTIMVIWYCVKKQGRSIRSIGFTKQGAYAQYLVGLVVGFVMFSAVVLAGTSFGAFEFVGVNPNMNLGLIALFFGGFIFQGMFEEVLCRGYIMISASRNKPIIYGIILNSVVFAFLHGLNTGIGILPIANLILFAVFASLYTLRTDNIWGVSAMHTVWNFAQGNLYGMSVSGMETMPSVLIFKNTGSDLFNGGAFGPEGGLIVTFIFVIGIILLITPTKSNY